MELTAEARKNATQVLGVDSQDELCLYKKYAPGNIIGREAALAWQERYRQEQETGHAEEPEQPKKRGRKARGQGE